MATRWLGLLFHLIFSVARIGASDQPCVGRRVHEHDTLYTNKILAVMQGLCPLFLRLASQQGKPEKQAGAL
jgi:hypothetical protein